MLYSGLSACSQAFSDSCPSQCIGSMPLSWKSVFKGVICELTARFKDRLYTSLINCFILFPLDCLYACTACCLCIMCARKTNIYIIFSFDFFGDKFVEESVFSLYIYISAGRRGRSYRLNIGGRLITGAN